MTTPSLKIDNKEIDLKQFLTALSTDPDSREETTFRTQLKIDNYSDLGFTISSLIGVCQVAIGTFADDEESTEQERVKYLGAGLNEVVQVLKVVKDLIPTTEFELLNKLQNQKSN